MLLKGRKVLITGATGGIGCAICEVFLQNGASLFLTGTNQKVLQDFRTNLLSKQDILQEQKIGFQQCDLSKRHEIVSLVKDANSFLNGIDILVCNAGITNDGLAIKMSDEQWQKVIDINLTANFILSRECLKIMMKQKFGKIINITSVVGIIGNAGQINYCASKAGLIAITKTIAKEYATKGITANCIAPGFIDTDMTKSMPEETKRVFLDQIPLKQLGQPINIANACLFLASNMSDYITGETLSVNGGLFMK